MGDEGQSATLSDASSRLSPRHSTSGVVGEKLPAWLTNAPRDLWLLGRLYMPAYFATFYAAIVLIWHLDRMARNSRPRCFVGTNLTPAT